MKGASSFGDLRPMAVCVSVGKEMGTLAICACFWCGLWRGCHWECFCIVFVVVFEFFLGVFAGVMWCRMGWWLL